jgi:hypothetical protein
MPEDFISEVILLTFENIIIELTICLGIPPNYADEELLKMFLNNVISKGLKEENDFSYGNNLYSNAYKIYSY